MATPDNCPKKFKRVRSDFKIEIVFPLREAIILFFFTILPSLTNVLILILLSTFCKIFLTISIPKITAFSLQIILTREVWFFLKDSLLVISL